jgi:hypothetical protein
MRPIVVPVPLVGPIAFRASSIVELLPISIDQALLAK